MARNELSGETLTYTDSTKRKRIMVVEDEGVTAMMISSSLVNMGYSVIAAEFSGEDAVKKAEEDSPDLILMDIVLDGEMDGIEAAGEIQSRLRIPVVYLTSHSSGEMMKRIKKSEPFGHIIKPFDDRELHDAIEMALYKHEMEEKSRK